MNAALFRGGYRFNPDSFRTLEVRGARVLQKSGSYQSARDVPTGLITGLKDRLTGRFKALNSLRDFVLWLHQHRHESNYSDLMEMAEPEVSPQP